MGSQLADGGFVVLQYVDDTILYLDVDLENSRNRKFNLCLPQDQFPKE
jgi:hypothetical protein